MVTRYSQKWVRKQSISKNKMNLNLLIFHTILNIFAKIFLGADRGLCLSVEGFLKAR